jgi:hypothetical protein
VLLVVANQQEVMSALVLPGRSWRLPRAGRPQLKRHAALAPDHLDDFQLQARLQGSRRPPFLTHYGPLLHWSGIRERAGYPLDLEWVRQPLLIALLDQLPDPCGRKILPA